MEELLKRQRETARQRALRIPLAYHRTRGAVWFWRIGLSLACFLGGTSYIAWVLTGGKSTAMQVSPGTLARDHARWDNDCKACHTPLVTQRADADGTRALSLLLAGNGAYDSHRQSDARCSECHKTASAHHANQIVAEVEACASCHRDHQGREFDMARMDDAHCTSCHASIAGHRTRPGLPGTSPLVNVTAFERAPEHASSGHPAFRSLQGAEDPGNIRFSHALHMTLGQLYPGQKAPEGKRLVQLACVACHQPETTTGNGAYMRPIKYEQHCRSCHPLNIPGQPESVVPHGLSSKQLESTVRGFLAVNKVEPAKREMPQRIIPGRSKSGSGTQTHEPAEMRVAQRLAQLRENKCSECHSWQASNPVEVEPAKIPSKWLLDARFSHQKHQNIAKCTDCHAQAAASLPAEGVRGRLADNQQIMIPNIDNCVRCHSPRSEAVGSGTARFDCAECHQYHSKTSSPRPLLASQISNLKPQSSRPKSQTFVGTQSCSTTGCHGATTNERGIASAFTHFAADDPHERAFLLLHADSSRRMINRLRGKAQPELNEPAYFAALQEKCLGCHATPPAEIAHSDRPQSYLSGITCESCHGAAAAWEYSHFQRGAKPGGLAQLSDLSQRATTCAECHIGPKEMLGKSYDVNHDLIAAGHPRLTFEFEAQSANLPAHWHPAKDIKSHFEAWRLGELATATQQGRLHVGRSAPEFASHRCFDCHHGLTPKPAAGRIAFPPLTGMTKEQREILSSAGSSQDSANAILLRLLGGLSDDANNGSTGTRWEEHVHFSLALSAYAAANPPSGDWEENVVKLNELLANSFRSLPQDGKLQKAGSFTGSLYDSPNGFDPQDERLRKVLENIRAGLSAP